MFKPSVRKLRLTSDLLLPKSCTLGYPGSKMGNGKKPVAIDCVGVLTNVEGSVKLKVR